MNLRRSTFGLLAGLIVISQGVSYWRTTSLLQEAIKQREADKVQSLGKVADALFTHFSLRAKTTASILRGDPRIVEAMTRDDARQTLQMADTLGAAAAESKMNSIEAIGADEVVRHGAPGRRGKRAQEWGVYEALSSGTSTQTLRARRGALDFTAIEPIRAAGRVTGALSATVRFDQAEIDNLATETGTDLVLIARTGVLLRSAGPVGPPAEPEARAVEDAFHQKIPMYRHDPGLRRTSVYLPLLIVDEAFVLLVQVDSTAAYRLVEDGERQAILVALLLLAASFMLGYLILWRVLSPLRALGSRARKLALELTGLPLAAERRDEIDSVVKTLDALTARLVVRNRELEESRLEAHTASQAKSRFLASMSHEIRTPLNGILGMTELLQNTPLGPTQQRYCEAVVSSGRALRDLLGNILDLAKIEAGRFSVERADFDLAALLAEMESVFGELSAARRNQFQVSAGPGVGIRLHGDSTRLRQVLINLVSNAIKFTENGSIELAVESIASRPGDERRWLRFTVRDSGIGMSPATLSRLFQPFSQADETPARVNAGTGLGLAIAKQLTELMGGSIRVESTRGSGSTFHVELPFEEAHMPAVALRAAAPVLPAPLAEVPLSILLVEDNDINQKVAQAMLEGGGHRVELATDGAQAVRLCARRRYDCVLMDCQMPVMDGFEATRRIRADELRGGADRMPIVALTANAVAGQRERCLAAGMDSFLVKPFDSATLLAAVAGYAPEGAGQHAHAPVLTTFDPSALDEIVALDVKTPGFLRQILARYLDDTPSLIEIVAQASDSLAAEAERAAHSIKSTSAIFGAPALSALAARAEADVRNGRLAEARRLAADMRLEFARVGKAFESFVASRAGTQSS